MKALIALALLMLFDKGELSAQQERIVRGTIPPKAEVAPSSSAPVTFVLRSGSDSSGKVTVIRRPSGQYRELVVASPRATAKHVALAFRELQRARARFGDRLEGEIRTTIESVENRAPARRRELDRAVELLAEARASDETSVAGVGRGRLVLLQLEPLTKPAK